MFLVDRLLEALIAGGIGIFGGVSAYVYRLTKTREKFNVWSFVAAVIIAFFVGNVFGTFVPKDLTYRDGLFMLCGFLSYPILGLLERGGVDWLKSFIPNGTQLKDERENNDE